MNTREIQCCFQSRGQVLKSRGGVEDTVECKERFAGACGAQEWAFVVSSRGPLAIRRAAVYCGHRRAETSCLALALVSSIFVGPCGARVLAMAYPMSCLAPGPEGEGAHRRLEGGDCSSNGNVNRGARLFFPGALSACVSEASLVRARLLA